MIWNTGTLKFDLSSTDLIKKTDINTDSLEFDTDGKLTVLRGVNITEFAPPNSYEVTTQVTIIEPTTTPHVNPVEINSEYKYLAFTYSGTELDTTYQVNFSVNTTCDIIIVGGGGGGGPGHGGGGGAGGLVYIHRCTLNGSYNVKVGKGGIGGISTEEIGTRQATKGINSSFDIVVAKGGGANTNIVSDKNGGCGAGGDAYYPDGGTNGIGLKNTTTNNFPSGTLYSFGNNGGLNGDWGYVGGGGGGVGGVGGYGGFNDGFGGVGLSGISEVSIDFRRDFNLPTSSIGDYSDDDKVYFGGGGGGGHTNEFNGSLGGGGNGGLNGGSDYYGRNKGNDGLANSGGGGGGGSGGGGTGGDGGSGIVIIRYLAVNTAIVTPTGYLKYDMTNGWNIDTKIDKILKTTDINTNTLEIDVNGKLNVIGDNEILKTTDINTNTLEIDVNGKLNVIGGSEILKTTDINTNTLEIDVNGKLNVIGGSGGGSVNSYTKTELSDGLTNYNLITKGGFIRVKNDTLNLSMNMWTNSANGGSGHIGFGSNDTNNKYFVINSYQNFYDQINTKPGDDGLNRSLHLQNNGQSRLVIYNDRILYYAPIQNGEGTLSINYDASIICGNLNATSININGVNIYDIFAPAYTYGFSIIPNGRRSSTTYPTDSTTLSTNYVIFDNTIQVKEIIFEDEPTFKFKNSTELKAILNISNTNTSQWTTTDNNIIYNSGTVGINTPFLFPISPYKLIVEGDVYFHKFLINTSLDAYNNYPFTWYNTDTDGNIFSIYLNKETSNTLFNLPVNTIKYNTSLPDTGFLFCSNDTHWLYINDYGIKTHNNFIFQGPGGIVFTDNSTLNSSSNLLKTTDINTSTLEIDVNGKLNVIQQVPNLTSYNAPISCTTLSTRDITATSDLTYIATFSHTNLTQGIGIGYDRIVAMGSNASQNITIVTKGTGSLYVMTNGTTRFYIDGNDGGMRMANNIWHRSLKDGQERFYFSQNNTTYLRGYSSTCFQLRNGIGASILELYSNNNMWIRGSLTQNSDERIKTNIQDINDDDALNKILALEPKTYEYIDKTAMGDETVYGFIAQQVKEVLPKAVEIVSTYIPNIMKHCDCEGDKIYVSIPQDVLVETDIKIIDKDEIECKIIEIGTDYIKIDKTLDVNSIFVYGYKVDDFHRMRKDYIYTVNVCATQILSRKIDEQQQEINDLKTKLNSILAYLDLPQ